MNYKKGADFITFSTMLAHMATRVSGCPQTTVLSSG